MKRWMLAAVVLILASGPATAATPTDDPAAVALLDRMAQIIGELRSCSYRLDVVHDVTDPDHGLITQHAVFDVHLVGPDKMRIDSRFDNAHRGYWYNGKTVAYYSYDENNYTVVDGASNIIETIEKMHREYGADFPAADFFYPTFTDDLIDNSTEIRYLGRKVLAGTPCFHVLAASPTTRIQIWIADDAFNLPLAFSINETVKKTRYVARFSDWEMNPEIPPTVFEFQPPKNAAKVTLVPKTKR